MTLQRIGDYIRLEILNDPSLVIEPDQDLLLSELLDSLAVTRLVAFLEQEFGVDIPVQDVTLENFATLRKIETFLGTLQENEGA